MDRHTGAKWLIHGPKHPKDNHNQPKKAWNIPAEYPNISWKCRHDTSEFHRWSEDRDIGRCVIAETLVWYTHSVLFLYHLFFRCSDNSYYRHDHGRDIITNDVTNSSLQRHGYHYVISGKHVYPGSAEEHYVLLPPWSLCSPDYNNSSHLYDHDIGAIGAHRHSGYIRQVPWLEAAPSCEPWAGCPYHRQAGVLLTWGQDLNRVDPLSGRLDLDNGHVLIGWYITVTSHEQRGVSYHRQLDYS